MGKRFVEYPNSSVDELVEQWATRHGIDMRRDVMRYELRRGAGDPPTITLTMLFDDEPAPATGGLVVQRYLVGENGLPTNVPAETDKKE